MVNLMKMVRVKVGGRSGKGDDTVDKTSRDKKTTTITTALRHSRSMPFRTSSESECTNDDSNSTSTSSGSRPSLDSFHHIRGPDYPKILLRDGGKEVVQHCSGCDCVFCACGDILVQFPAPPPQRPRHRPRDMSRDFDDMEIVPHKTELQRQRRQAAEAEAEEIRETVEWYNIQAALCRRTGRAVNMSERQYGILHMHHPLFRREHQLDGSVCYQVRKEGKVGSAQGAGASVQLSSGPVVRKPRVVTKKPSFGTIASSRPVMVTGLNQSEMEDDAPVYSSYDGGSTRSLNPHGRRNLQGYPAVSRIVSDSLSSRSKRRQQKYAALSADAHGRASVSPSVSTPVGYGWQGYGSQYQPQGKVAGPPPSQSSFTAAAIRSRERGHQQGSASVGGSIGLSSPMALPGVTGHARSVSSSQLLEMKATASGSTYKAKAPTASSTLGRGRGAKVELPVSEGLMRRVEVDSSGRSRKAVPVPKVSGLDRYGRI